MNPEGAPASVLRFIDRFIESVEQLEILLLLSSEPRDWQPAEILQRIQSSQASIADRLRLLTAAGLIANTGPGYRFEPKDPSLGEVVRELAEVYRERRVRVIEAIYARKTDSVQSFADAFKFKRKD